MQDTRGDVTFTLLRGASYIKDNRILPRGADKGSLPADIAVRGDAQRDADFRAGEDTVHYRVKALPAGHYRVRAVLLYQTLSARFASDLFSTQGAANTWFQQAYGAAAYKTIELTRFEGDLHSGASPQGTSPPAIHDAARSVVLRRGNAEQSPRRLLNAAASCVRA